MPKRVLAIGVGGTGKACLTLLKERLIETYGQVPDEVTLLAFDTDNLHSTDTFTGVCLNPNEDKGGRPPEFVYIDSPPGVTLDTVFADITSGYSADYMNWLEKEKLEHTLSPSDRNIRGGVQQRRPLGRVALFLRWNIIHESIVDAIAHMYDEPGVEPSAKATAKDERLIFIITSASGGTGSGFFIDVANLIRSAVQSDVNWQSIDVAGIIALPDAFQSYTSFIEDPSNLKPNSYATLRELDRFIRSHTASTPYMIRYGADESSITWSTNQPHVYLVDTTSRGASQEFNLAGDPMRGVFPVIADFIMAHVDQSLGKAMSTLRSNAGYHYVGASWPYSGFNLISYILPVADIISSFSYRFLRQLLARQFLPLLDKNKQVQLDMEALQHTESVFSQNSIGGHINLGLVLKSIAATHHKDPEQPDVSWPSLFNMIALPDSTFAEDYQTLKDGLAHLSSTLIATGKADYKKESYADGYNRLMKFGDYYMDECLGFRTDSYNEEARLIKEGQWGIILGRYQDELFKRFAVAVDAALLDILNKRDPKSSWLLPYRLPFARSVVAALQQKLVDFKEVLTVEYGYLDIDLHLRKTAKELRNAIAWMQQTKDNRPPLISFGRAEALKAQDAYISLFLDKMELTMHQLIFKTVLDVLDALGAADKDQAGNKSVLSLAALELEKWETVFKDVNKLLTKWAKEHDKNRAEKRRVKVRRYLTNDEFEDEFYRQREHSGSVGWHVLGKVRAQKGITWGRIEEHVPLQYKMVNVWAKETREAEKIAYRFFTGVKELFQVVRENTSVADRIATVFSSPAAFVNKVGEVNEPLLRYQPALNDKQMAQERFVSFNLDKTVENKSRDFLEQAIDTIGNQMYSSIDAKAESQVACTVVEVARGCRLAAVDQFVACEPDYRNKLEQGQERLHLFPEEQIATQYEGRIDALGEADNYQRLLSPELVLAMGDDSKLKTFTLACVVGLIEKGHYIDHETGLEATELFLDLRKGGFDHCFPLSQSRLVFKLNKNLRVLRVEDQEAYFYLDALQCFALKVTQKQGIRAGMTEVMVEQLERHSVNLRIENPFTLSLTDVTRAINYVFEDLLLSEAKELNQHQRDVLISRRRLEKMQSFLSAKVEGFKKHPDQRIKDMGTVMHLILQSEIKTLRQRTQGKTFQAVPKSSKRKKLTPIAIKYKEDKPETPIKGQAMNESNVEIPQELVEALAKDEVVLFLGRGVAEELGASATIPSDTYMAAELIQRCNYQGKDKSLPAVAQSFEDGRGRQALLSHMIDFIDKATGQGSAPPPEPYRLIAKLPFQVIITTIHDDMLEKALKKGEKPPERMVNNPNLAFSRSNKLAVIHLYGHYKQIETMKITQDDIEGLETPASLQKTDAIRNFLQTNVTRRTLLFIGFSNSDDFFRKFYFRSISSLGEYARRAYVFATKANQAEQFRPKKYNVEIIQTTSQAGLSALYKAFLNQQPQSSNTAPSPLVSEETTPAPKMLDEAAVSKTPSAPVPATPPQNLSTAHKNIIIKLLQQRFSMKSVQERTFYLIAMDFPRNHVESWQGILKENSSTAAKLLIETLETMGTVPNVLDEKYTFLGLLVRSFIIESYDVESRNAAIEITLKYPKLMTSDQLWLNQLGSNNIKK